MESKASRKRRFYTKLDDRLYSRDHTCGNIYLWQELETYRRVDWDVSSNAKSNKGGKNKNSVIIIWGRKTEAENSREEDREVESVLAT